LHISKTRVYLQEKCDKKNPKIELSNAKKNLPNTKIAFLNVNDFKLGKAFFAFENQSIEFAKDSFLSLNVKLLWQNNMKTESVISCFHNPILVFRPKYKKCIT
jgi:hypothetical protein